MSVALLSAGGALMVIGCLSWIGRLRRNPWVGVRIPATMRSDEAWRAGHRAVAPLFVVMGAAFVGGAVAQLFVAEPVIFAVALAALVPFLLLSLLVSTRAAKAA